MPPHSKDRQQARADRFAQWLVHTKLGERLQIGHVRALFLCFVTFTHALYWLTASWSPFPYLLFMLVGVWVGQGVLAPWAVTIERATRADFDPWLLKVGIPFIPLNYIALFACLYMFGSVTDPSGDPIEGTWMHFYFSAVTLTTLGYGNLVPADGWAQFIAIIESIVGLVAFAVITGIFAAIAMRRIELGKGKDSSDDT